MSALPDYAVHDNVHGLILLSPLSGAVVHTPTFARLREIKQLGALSNAITSATHTRAAHSLGAAHLARWWLREVLSPSAAACNAALGERELLAGEVAALLHDVGHGVSSHTIEEALHLANAGCTWSHEDASELLIRHVFHEEAARLAPLLPSADFVDLVVALVRPKMHHAALARLLPSYMRWLASIVSSDLDVDRCDYFLRDASACGVPIPFSPKLLLGGARVVPGTCGDCIIAWDGRVPERIVLFFKSRYQLYSDVYLKPCNRRLELMERDVLRAAIEEGFTLPDGSTLLEATRSASAWMYATDVAYKGMVPSRYPRAAALLSKMVRGDLYLVVLDMLVHSARHGVRTEYVPTDAIDLLARMFRVDGEGYGDAAVVDVDTITNGIAGSTSFPLFVMRKDGSHALSCDVRCTVDAMEDARLRVYVKSPDSGARAFVSQTTQRWLSYLVQHGVVAAQALPDLLRL